MDATTAILSVVIGIVASVIASVIFLVVTFKVMRPRVGFSDSISQTTETSNSGQTRNAYRIKIENTGCGELIDVEVSARLVLPRRGLTHVIFVPLLPTGEEFLRIGRLRRTKPGIIGSRRVVSLYIDQRADYLANHPGFAAPTNWCPAESLNLEGALAVSPRAFVQLTVLAADSRTGLRHLCESKQYRLADVKRGRFTRGGLSVKERETEPTSSATKSPVV